MKFLKITILATSLLFTSAQLLAQDTKEVKQEQENLTQVALKVSGINCGNDLKKLRLKVADLNGVTSCEVKGKRGVRTTFNIVYNSSVISEKELRTAFESTPGCEDPNELPYKVK